MNYKYYWQGKDIEEMSKEELIEVVKILGKQYNNALEQSIAMNKTWGAIARARN